MQLSDSRLSKQGDRYLNFEVTRALPIHELQCQMLELVHLPTGAKILHLGCDDPENLFCLSFQTLPSSSNGVAHILEHTVLCGSKKFPVKDPFFSMTRRSLNTFMNALTGADFTCYPAATQITKDFYNLLDVYLDAVFEPNLHELSFMQEGCRLEFSSPNDPASPLTYKGIVFNEMKGAMTSSSSRLYELLNQALFPNITYGVNAGGDPKEIPALTYEELKTFHNTYYHPSRCLFFFYGNLPLQGHLDFIAKNTLDEAKKAPPLPPIPLQPRFTAPRRIEGRYPLAENESPQGKTMISFGWLTTHILNQQDLLALNILEIALLDTDASPVKYALLQSGLCKQVGSYMELDNHEVPFVISLKGCEQEDADAIEAVIFASLRKIQKEGIPQDLIENALHQLEFHRSEITGNHSPFGLSLFMRAALLKQHEASPEEGLQIHALFKRIREASLADPAYFTQLIDTYFLNNPHFVRASLIPDHQVGKEELEEEKKHLEAVQEGLTADQAEEIIKKMQALAAFQEEQEDVDPNILPKVTLADVPPKSRDFKLTETKEGALTLFHHGCFTNEIVYADLIFELPHLSREELPLVRLFTSLLSQMGCGKRSYTENLDFIQANTGGIGASLVFNLQASDPRQFSPSLCLRGKALHRKAEPLFRLMREMCTSVNFKDIPRLKELLMKQYTSLQSHLTQSAMKYAINLSAKSLDVPSTLANIWYGLPYYWSVKEWAEKIDSCAEELAEKLQLLSKKLLCLEHPHLVLTCEEAFAKELKNSGFYGLSQLPTRSFPKWKCDLPLEPTQPQGRVIPSQVAFIGKVFKTVPYVHKDAPALSIAACLFDNLTLHTRIREQGGAYGGGAISNPMSENFYFYSYRDPHIVPTLAAFEEAIEEVISGNFDEEDLEEAKLEMVQSLDVPVAPGSRGDLAYGWLREGKTHELRQAFRNQLLSLTKTQVLDAVIKHIAPHFSQGATVVFAGIEVIEKGNKDLIAKGQAPLTIEKV